MRVQNPSLLSAVSKLALAGESAGFSVEEMIQLLNAGVSIEALLQMIAARLDAVVEKPAAEANSPRWVV